MDQTAEQDTGEDPEADDRPLPRRRRHGRIGLGMVASLIFAGLIFTVLVLSLSGRSVPMPELVRARIEQAINERLGHEQFQLGRVDLSVGRDGIPRVTLSDVAIGNPADGAVAVLNQLRARLSLERLLRGEVAASRLELDGAQITVRRAASGEFAFRSGQVTEAETQSLPEFLDLIDRVFASTALAALRRVEAGGIVVSLEDAQSGRLWQVTNASLVLRRGDQGTTLTLVSDVFNGTDDVAEVQLSIARNLATSGVSLGMSMRGMPAADIALQTPALSWLSVLDAPISGAVRTELGADGAMTSLAGKLDIEAGALQPLPDVAPVGFDSARAYFTFDAGRQRIDFSEIAVVSDRGRVDATGHTYLAEMNGAWPGAFLGQFVIQALEYDGSGIFQGPLALSDIRSDLRLRLDPFTVDIGQLSLSEGGAEITSTGQITAKRDGWHVNVDSQSPTLGTELVMDFWPTIVSPLTRDWISENLRTGILRNVSAGLRFVSGSKPDALLSFDFEEGDVTFLKTMPPLMGASGRVSLIDRRFTLVLDKGLVDVGTAGALDAAGSVFRVPDTRPKPATGQIALRASGPLEAALTLLNNPPLRVMDRAGKSPTFAEAVARAEAQISLPLAKKVSPEQVEYEVTAELSDVSSDNIAEGRFVRSDRLSLSADRTRVRLEGPLDLDGVPIRAVWEQPLGEAASQGSRVSGSMTVTGPALHALGIELPEGLIKGRGSARFELALAKDEIPRLEVSSDLTGLEMSIDGIGWGKAASTTGGFELIASLGETPEVESVALSAPGLALDGRLALGAGGGFQGAVFDSIRIGDWLDGAVELAFRGPGRAPGIAVKDGRLDLRHLPKGRGTGDGSVMDVRLNEIVVSENISLTSVAGRFQRGRAGFSGEFVGRVNGATALEGTLAPANAGTAIRIRSDDAGGVVSNAGITQKADGGTLDLVLSPVSGAPDGTYDGQFLIESVRLRKAPAMADLLDAISVVGLIDQLQGPGIHFTTVDGRFRLTKDRLTLYESAAVGGSLGISADGIYELASKQLDFRGVISPVYFVNGIGSLLTRRGEGMFGFSYRMTGPADDPKVKVNPLSILAPGVIREIFRGRQPGE